MMTYLDSVKTQIDEARDLESALAIIRLHVGHFTTAEIDELTVYAEQEHAK